MTSLGRAGRTFDGVGMIGSAAIEPCTTVAAHRAAVPAPQHHPAGSPAGRLAGGRCRIRSLLGRGGNGRVWLAEDELLCRPVALKQHLPSYAGSAEKSRAARARALNEACAAARVNHDGIIKIHDVVRDGSLLWIVMEPLVGRTLAETVTAEGPLPIDRVLDLALRLLAVLRAIHAESVIHRDVKPANVYLCDDGRVVLTDFGIACMAGHDEIYSPDGVLAGSPAYISPEQLRGVRPEPAADLFSLGATLFAAVEGRNAFDKGDVLATLTAVMEDAPAPCLRAGPLRPVIEGLLAKSPDQRLTAEQALAALADLNQP
jgi:serine/threonine protein kinase